MARFGNAELNSRDQVVARQAHWETANDHSALHDLNTHGRGTALVDERRVMKVGL
jgi:hypothetical protein